MLAKQMNDLQTLIDSLEKEMNALKEKMRELKKENDVKEK